MVNSLITKALGGWSACPPCAMECKYLASNEGERIIEWQTG